MMEYIFFDESLRDRFVDFLNSLSVAYELQVDNMGMVVRVADDLTDELMDTLEVHYEELESEQSQLMAQIDGGLRSLAGFSLVLPDGAITTVPLQPDVANRLLSNFSIDEIQALFSTIARCALEPKEKHLCAILHGDVSASK